MSKCFQRPADFAVGGDSLRRAGPAALCESGRVSAAVLAAPRIVLAQSYPVAARSRHSSPLRQAARLTSMRASPAASLAEARATIRVEMSPGRPQSRHGTGGAVPIPTATTILFALSTQR